MIPLLGYTPDIDPSTPGAMVEVTNMVPSVKGMKGAPSGIDGGYVPLAATVVGFAVTRILDGSRRIFAGTATKLYELSGGAVTDRSRVGNYTLGPDTRWAFSQFGDITLAAATGHVLQASSPGNNFADVAAAPKAKYVDTSQGFVMLAGTNDATFGDSPDRWWCSAFQDYTDWTPSITTQSASGRLIDSPGPIRGLKALGPYFVAYKDRAIFLATYVGGDTIWQWTQIPGEVGTDNNEAIVNTGYAHFFLGNDDFYIFDGTRCVSIGAPIREWFFANLNKRTKYRVIGAYDRTQGNVWWHFVSASNDTTSLDVAVVYNVRTQKWGRVSLNVEYVAEYFNTGVTYDGLGAIYATYDALPTTISYDSPYWNGELPIIAYFDTSHDLKLLIGTSVSSSFISGKHGDDEQLTTVTAVRPRFEHSPDTTTMTCQHSRNGVDWTNGSTSSLNDYKYDCLRSDRWHRFGFAFTGDVEIVGYQPYASASGKR